MGKTNRESSVGTRLEKSSKLVNAYFSASKKDYSYLYTWTKSNWQAKTENMNPTWKVRMKDVDWESRHRSLTKCIWVALKEDVK